MPATDASITAKLHPGLTSGVASRAAQGAIGAVMHHYDIEPLIASPLTPLAATPPSPTSRQILFKSPLHLHLPPTVALH